MKHTITLYIDIRHFTYLCNTMKHYILFLFALLPFLSFGQCIIEATERGANRYYWDNDIAWLNKYKNRDPLQGPACFGCTTFLAWTRDGLHLTGSLSNVSGVVSLSLPLYKGPNQTIWQYLAEIGISSFGYWLGFHWVYTLGFP